jgi:hypothetical protein
MRKFKRKHPNAQKHAVFSKFLILPGENPREFQKLMEELAEEWQPEGKTEADAVLEIAKGIWLKRRVQLFLKIEGIKNAGNPDHPSYDERIGLHAFLAYAERFPESAFLHGARYLRKGLLDALVKKYPRSEVTSNEEWFTELKKEITSLFPLYDHAYSDEFHLGLMNAAATFSGDLFERAIMLDERLNAAIDRATKRLIQIKAMKQMLGHAPKKPKGELIKLRGETAQPGKIREFSQAPDAPVARNTKNG